MEEVNREEGRRCSMSIAMLRYSTIDRRKAGELMAAAERDDAMIS
jgi:hypothetical protein